MKKKLLNRHLLFERPDFFLQRGWSEGRQVAGNGVFERQLLLLDEGGDYGGRSDDLGQGG